jgi:ADP-dependent NAD(P)H-hydrate dehydratase / NAD(P)H-hydrate epimerase
MIPILTPAEAAELDRRSVQRGVSTRTLMENAGRAVARAALGVAGGVYGRRVAVVCGKGNNGGDGLVAARHLHRWGAGVSAVLMAEPGTLQGPTEANLARFRDASGRLLLGAPGVLERELARADVVIDALFGTGFRRRPEGPARTVIDAINAAPGAVVAVDIPSGVDGETGAVRGAAVAADLTMTFGALKPGLVFHPGAGHAGVIEIADIGYPAGLLRSDLFLVERDDAAALLPRREPDTHKRASGVVLVLAGSRGMTGAPRLAAEAAYRVGAGLVTLAVPKGILPVVQAGLAEATFLPLAETPNGGVAAEAWRTIEERLESVDAVAVGPGLGTDPSTADLVRRLVVQSPVPVVLDADGLNAFAGRGHFLADRKADAVLTPHAGEFGRLVGLSSEEVVDDRVGHARKAAAEFRCPVLLKGSRTVVAEPEGRARINPTGGPELATGGTGDVLTGAIAAFVARGLDPADAAVLGAFVHGRAGRLSAEERAEGTVASDVLAMLPRAIAELW